MTQNLILIEMSVLEELLEKAYTYDVEKEYALKNRKMTDFIMLQMNKKVQRKKKEFLSNYVNVPVDLDESIADGLEKMGYK